MPYAPEHKQKTRKKIVHSARTLFNRRGFAEVSIDEIMAGAGLTRGGFYSHFSNKEELYAEAVTEILRDHECPDGPAQGVDFSLTGARLARMVVDAYLSQNHFDDTEASCPLISLPTDVARSGAATKAAYKQVLEAMIGIFEGAFPGEPDRAERARAMAALCVGAMVIGRAVGDEDLARAFREAARAQALCIGDLSQMAAE